QQKQYKHTEIPVNLMEESVAVFAPGNGKSEPPSHPTVITPSPLPVRTAEGSPENTYFQPPTGNSAASSTVNLVMVPAQQQQQQQEASQPSQPAPVPSVPVTTSSTATPVATAIPITGAVSPSVASSTGTSASAATTTTSSTS